MKKTIIVVILIIVALSIYAYPKISSNPPSNTPPLTSSTDIEYVHTLDMNCSKLYDEYYHTTYAKKDFVQKPDIEKKYTLSEECLQNENITYLIKEGEYLEKDIDIYQSETSYFEFIDQEVTLKFSDNTEVKLNEENPTLNASEKSINDLVSVKGDVLFLSNTKEVEENQNNTEYEFSEVE